VSSLFRQQLFLELLHRHRRKTLPFVAATGVKILVANPSLLALCLLCCMFNVDATVPCLGFVAHFLPCSSAWLSLCPFNQFNANYH
jgi:hypothetical protein